MPELTDAQKVMRNDTGKSIAEAIANMSITVAGQEVEVSDTEPQSKFVDVWFQEQQQGTPVMVYDTDEIDDMVEQTEKNLAYINTTSAAETTYHAGDYLVYNGQLYKVTATTITQGQTLTPGGNIQSTSVSDILNPPAVYSVPTDTGNCTIDAGGYIKIGSIVIVNIRFTLTGNWPIIRGFPRPIQNGINTIGICGYDGQNEKTAFGYINTNGELRIPQAYGDTGVILVTAVYITAD